MAGKARWPPVGMRIGNWSQMEIEIKLVLNQKETMRHNVEEVIRDTVDGEPVFVSDDVEDYSLVFG